MANCLLLSVFRLSHASLLPRPRTQSRRGAEEKPIKFAFAAEKIGKMQKAFCGLETRKERRAQLAKIVCMRRDNNNNNNTGSNNNRCNNNNSSSKLGKYLKKPIAAAASRSR